MERDEKIRHITLKVSQEDFEKVEALTERYREEANVRISKSGMIMKLIRDEYEKGQKK